MKKSLFYFFTTIVFTACVTGCAKQVQRSTTQENLAGIWQWVSTDGGIANNIHDTPESTGKAIELTIAEDGKYTIQTNGTVTSSGTYVLEARNCIHDHTNKTFINFSSDPDVMVENVTNDKLNVSDEAYDGVDISYKRKNINVK